MVSVDDRWDEEARKRDDIALGAQLRGEPDRWGVEAHNLGQCTCRWPYARSWDGKSHAAACHISQVAALARHAYREGLERAREIARSQGTDVGLALATAIRREIEGL